MTSRSSANSTSPDGTTTPGTTSHSTTTSPTTDSLTHRQAVGGVLPLDPAVAVVVAVLTYRRPSELALLLPELSRQAAGRPAIRVLVVDNDPAASGSAVVSAAADPTIRYVHEPRPGIAAARNRALDEAASYDLLVFIDDDEWPNPTWLESMLEVHDRTASAAVVGPVISEYAAEPDPWIKAGRFFDRRRLPSGTRIDVAATNNLLLDLRQVRAFGLRFDEAFGLSGGSDTLFTRELHRRGGALVWCDEAIVIDQVPMERLTRRWVLLRALRSG
ncbi:MAG TPA: glycosyltransferase, partial [Acidothermaceae bacterium]